MKTAVAFLIFNRPNATEKVFQAIRQSQPPILLLVADGPRKDKVGEAEKCAATRAIIDKVDWQCKVITNFADENLGCKLRVSSGLNWVFEQVEEAIILEDDCLPDPTFFRFCEELLERYKDDKRIMAISGNNLQFGLRRNNDSYYFSRYFHCWGWASWRRAWQHYDVEMKLWPSIRDSGWLKDLLQDTYAEKYWTKLFQSTYQGCINTWDYQWVFTCWIQNGLIISPNVNLVSNIGFGKEATHTQDTNNILANMRINSLIFPLKHPISFIRNNQADKYIENYIFSNNIIVKIMNKIIYILSNFRRFKIKYRSISYIYNLIRGSNHD